MNAPVGLDDVVFGRDAVGRIQGTVYRHRNLGGHAGLGHFALAQAAAGVADSVWAWVSPLAAWRWCSMRWPRATTFTYYFTLFLTPVMFLSGVFFRWSDLPEPVRRVSMVAPVQCGGPGAPAVHGCVAARALRHLAVLLVYAGVSFWLALALTRKRFRK